MEDATSQYTDFKSDSSKPHAVTYVENSYDSSGVLGIPSTTQTRYYFGDYEIERYSNGAERKIHYLSGGDGLAAVYVTWGYGRDSLLYAYTDNLVSVIALTDANHNVVERYAFDPWGARRNPTNWSQRDNRTSWLTNRGYTGHEHLDQFGVINMNGRVYDPLTAMFLSPDPFVQAPNNWLNYNRYGYCYNNPFKYTDPDGEWIHLLIGGIIGGFSNWIANGGEFTWKGLGHFAVGAAAGAIGAGIGAGISSALAGGSFSAGFTTAATTAGTSFLNGAAVGAGTGFSSGFTLGVGNGLLNGRGWNSLTDGLRDGLIGGGSGGLIGGLIGGVDAALDGRRFWDGATLEQVITHDAKLPFIRQNSTNNCAPACGESLSKGPYSQDDYRLMMGGGDEMVSDEEFWRSFSGKTKGFYEQLNPGSQTKLASDFAIGDAYAFSKDNHSVLLNKVEISCYKSLSGKAFYKYVYYVMDPGRGQYIRFNPIGADNWNHLFYRNLPKPNLLF